MRIAIATLPAGRSFLLTLLVFLTLPLYAGSTREVHVTELVGGSALIVHATVSEFWYDYDESTDTVFTSFRLDVSDVLKGAAPAEDLVLSFMGGKWKGRRLAISDMRMPAVGEEGVYFIEQPGRRQVNPLYGWRQGHFVVRHSGADSGRQVYTADLNPIASVITDPEVRFSRSIDGVARGIRLADGDGSMKLSSFKKVIRDIARSGQ